VLLSSSSTVSGVDKLSQTHLRSLPTAPALGQAGQKASTRGSNGLIFLALQRFVPQLSAVSLLMCAATSSRRPMQATMTPHPTPTNNTPTLLWFRQDLRLEDNIALLAAVERGKM